MLRRGMSITVVAEDTKLSESIIIDLQEQIANEQNENIVLKTAPVYHNYNTRTVFCYVNEI